MQEKKQKADKGIAKTEKEEALLASFFSIHMKHQRERKGKWE